MNPQKTNPICILGSHATIHGVGIPMDRASESGFMDAWRCPKCCRIVTGTKLIPDPTDPPIAPEPEVSAEDPENDIPNAHYAIRMLGSESYLVLIEPFDNQHDVSTASFGGKHSEDAYLAYLEAMKRKFNLFEKKENA